MEQVFEQVFGAGFWVGFWGRFLGRFLSRFLRRFLRMDTGGPKRKKRVVLKELEWELVRTFVKEYSAVAAKVTYDVLLAEMKKEYPDFHLENTAVKKHVGRIEKWKEEDGVPIQEVHL